MGEEIIRSEYLYRGHILKLRLDQTRLENKQIVQREIIEHTGAVAIVALDAKNNALMVRQYRSGASRELLEIPAGTIEEGEDPALCATRELKEETGYHALRWDNLGFFYSSPGFCTEKMYLYLARQLTLGAASPDADEILRAEIIPLDQLVAQIQRGEILDAKTIVGLLRANQIINSTG
jgi:ADP-ribose pyrophosphatase